MTSKQTDFIKLLKSTAKIKMSSQSNYQYQATHPKIYFTKEITQPKTKKATQN
jgi:hypothetical protein